MEFVAPDGARVRVCAVPSLGGNLFMVFRAKVLVVEQGSEAANLALAAAAWESAPKSTVVPPR